MSLALAPAPAPARPRMLIVGTALGVAAGSMLFASMLAFYLAVRDKALAIPQAWLPTGVKIPGIATNIMLITMAAASVMVQWAVYAIKRNDRTNTYVALALTVFFGLMVLNAQAYTWIQMRMVIFATTYSTLVYCITGTFFAAVIGGVVATALLTFRSLTGQYSSKDTEGISSVALYWHFLTVAFAAVWLIVYVVK